QSGSVRGARGNPRPYRDILLVLKWLIDNILFDITILQKWLKAGFVYQKQLFPKEAGMKQGGIIGPALANITLDGLEYALAKAFPYSIKEGLKMNLVLYCDDFIIIGYSKEWMVHEVMPILVNFS
ncbi:MAG: reverse transcriptase domain-containing protein, partial [Chlorobium sp.]